MLLEVRDLQVSYGNIQALHGISFSVDEGEIVTLIGANGAGKSTILMTISRQIPHVAELGGKVTSGSIMYRDEDLLQYEPHQVVGKFGISQVNVLFAIRFGIVRLVKSPCTPVRTLIR